MMNHQLQPLVDLAVSLEKYSDASDIVVTIRQAVLRASTPSMGQSVCDHIIEMCHPRAWGDRYVSGLTTDEWFRILDDLSNLAAKCGQDIYDASGPAPAQLFTQALELDTAMAEQFIEGMTVNERLYHFGLMDRFDAAVRSGDVSAMEQVLRQAKFPESQALQTSKVIAADPKRYGY